MAAGRRDADDRRIRRGAGELAAAAGRRFDVRLQTEPQREPVVGDGDRVGLGAVIGVRVLAVIAQRPRVERDRRDDPFAVLQLKQLLDRFAEAGRLRQVLDAAGVANAGGAEETDRLPGAAADQRQDLVALTQTDFGDVFDLALAFDPAVAGNQNVTVLGDDKVLLAVFDLFLGVIDPRASFALGTFAVGFDQRLQFLADDPPTSAVVGVGGRFLEQLADLPRPFVFVLQLVQHDVDFEFRQPVELQFEDRVGLVLVQTLAPLPGGEAFHDLRRRVGLAVAVADDLEDLVQRVEDQRESVQDVDASFQGGQLVFEARGDDVQTEVQEVPQRLLQRHAAWRADLRILRRRQARQVDVEVVLQRRVLEQIRQDFVFVRALLQRQVDADIFGRKVADVGDQRQFPAVDQCPDAFAKNRFVDAERDAVDAEDAVFAFLDDVGGAPQFDRARTGGVDLAKLFLGVDDLSAGRKVRALDGVAGDQLIVLDVGVGQQFQ